MSDACSLCEYELKEDWNLCPECGKIIKDRQENLKWIQTKTTPGNQKVADKMWILTLIAGIIGFLSLLTPADTTTVSIGGTVLLSMDSWLFGLNIFYEYGVGYDVFFTRNELILGVGIVSLVILIIANLAAIISGITGRRDAFRDLTELGIAIMQVIGALIYIIGMAIVYWLFTREAYWGLFGLGFAMIGQFISAGLLGISLGIRLHFTQEI
ncbi:MAG: hypothetical protein ACXABG_15810 [Promethearchaeota archaeon]|jgi:hypothetical protein